MKQIIHPTFLIINNIKQVTHHNYEIRSLLQTSTECRQSVLLAMAFFKENVQNAKCATAKVRN